MGHGLFCPDKQRYFDFFILIVIFIISRLLFLFLTPYANYVEEAKIGSIGHDIVFERRLRLPFWGYLDSPHAGGSLFSGLSAIPFYIIFGDKYLALKITALVFSLSTLLLWYRLLSSEIEARRSLFILFLIFFSFATPHYVQKSIILIGNTVELMFFNALIISYFWKIRNNPFGIQVRFFFLGMLCGFAFWVQFMSSYLFLTILLMMFFTKKFAVAGVQSLLLIAGFILGALPLWIYNLHYEWATLTADPRAKMNFLFNLGKLKQFLFVDLPASFHFLNIGPIKTQHLSYVIYGTFILAILIHLGKNLTGYIKGYSQKRIGINLEFFLILYILVFIIITSFTSFPIRSNEAYGWNSMNIHAEYYIISLQPIIFALLILLSKYKNRSIFLLHIIVGIIFILGYTRLFSQVYYNNDLFKPMHSINSNAYECGFNFIKNPRLFLRFKQKIPYELQVEYMKGARDGWQNFSHEIKKQIIKKAEILGSDYIHQYLILNNL